MAVKSTVAARTTFSLRKVLRPERENLTPTDARALLKLDFTEEDRRRMHELSLKAQEGILTDEERDEILSYEHFGVLLGIMHSRARQVLKRSAKRS